MIVCSSCGTHHRPHTACPHCADEASAPTVASRTPAVVAAVLAMGLVACNGGGDSAPEPQALYGVVVTDEDDDGYDAGSDCDDADPAVHPGATETAGDGVDSNCDGNDDT
jgi:hypothetical protein